MVIKRELIKELEDIVANMVIKRELIKELEDVANNEYATVPSRRRSLTLIIEFRQLESKYKLKREEVIRFLLEDHNLQRGLGKL